MNIIKKNNNTVYISKLFGHKRYSIQIALDTYNKLFKSHQLESFINSRFEKMNLK